MIDYEYLDEMLSEGAAKHLLITDGTVTVTGHNYTVTGATITLTNELIHADSFKLVQSLCSQQQIVYGSCEAAEMSFTMSDNIPTIKGKPLKAYIYLNNDAATMLQLGVFKVNQDKLTGDRKKRNVVAYDTMYDILNADVAGWYNSLFAASQTVTLSAMRASLLTYLGVTAETATLVNDSMQVRKTISPDTLSGADAITKICEANGCFGTITNEGKFRFVELSPGIDDGLFPAEDLYPSEDLYPQDVNPSTTPITKAHYYADPSFEDWNSEEITQLTILTNDYDVGVTVGTPGNTYVISGNWLLYGKSASELTTIANNILSKMTRRYYRPAEVECVGNPCHELGDPVRINTIYRGIVTYILERELSGFPGLKDTYTAQGTQTYDQEINSISSKFEQTESKTLKLKADVDGVSAEVADLAAGTLASLSVLSSQIEAKVSSVGGSSETFGWQLTSSGFKLQSDGGTVLDCDRHGIEVAGSIVSDGSYGICKVYDGRVDVSSDGTNNTDYVHVQSMRSGGPSVSGWKSGSGMFLLAPGNVIVYDDSNKRFYASPSVIEWNGHELTFIEIPDANGVIRHVLGY